MWHKAEWMRPLMRLELIRESLQELSVESATNFIYFELWTVQKVKTLRVSKSCSLHRKQ